MINVGGVVSSNPIGWFHGLLRLAGTVDPFYRVIVFMLFRTPCDLRILCSNLLGSNRCSPVGDISVHHWLFGVWVSLLHLFVCLFVCLIINNVCALVRLCVILIVLLWCHISASLSPVEKRTLGDPSTAFQFSLGSLLFVLVSGDPGGSPCVAAAW